MRTLLIALGLSICSTVSATTYYVSTNGNNSNPGTISAPWATWGHAFNSTAVKPGDTVYFRGGIYPMTSDNLSYPYAAGCGYNVSRDGTSGNNICYFAYPGEKPVLDCGNVIPAGRTSRAIWGNDMNYVHFKGLTVRNVRQTSADVNVYGWVIEGRNIIVEGCTVHNCGGRGFFSTGHEIRYLNCDSHHNSDAMSASYPGNDGVGFQNVDLTNVDGSIYYKNCRAWMNGDQGFSAVSVGYLEFDGCWSFNNGQLQGEGHGFKMGAVGVDPTPFGPLKRKYTNCVAAFNRANGWTTNDNQTFYTHLMHIYNNTSYHNGYPTSFVGVSYGFIIYNTASVDSEELARTYRNNISYQNQHGATFIGAGALYTHSNNSWDISGLTITDSDFTSLDSTGITAARQSDYTLPNNSCYNNFLRLAPSSRLIDAGVNVSLPFSGTSPDLGAFESSSTPPVPAVPTYVSSSVENATPARLDINYNLTLANVVPSASAFSVRVNTVARSVSAVTISGTRVQLTLSSPVVYGDAVTVAYTKPSSNPIQTAAGGQAASFTAQNVTNNVGAVNPVYVSSSVENATPARLDINYNLTLANVVPSASAFSVRVNTVARSVSAVTISGTRVQLTLSSPVVYGDAVTVAYTKPSSNPIQTAAGGQAASFTAQNVTNNVGAVNPVYVSSSVENATPARLDINYNLTLANVVPSASAFSVRVNTVARSVSAVTISGTRVQLTLSSPVVYGDAVTVAYTKPSSNPIQTAAGGQAASFTAQNVTNNVGAVNPVFVSSSVENATPARLDINYNLTLASVVPSASAFSVRVNTVARSVSSVAVSGTRVQLTLSSPVVYGDAVTLAYTKPSSNPIQTTAGGQATSFTAQNVTNNVGAVNQPPLVNISSPTKSNSFVTPATITIDATATDPDGTIARVEFYQGSIKLGEKTSAPYSFTWKDVPAGTYSITAAAIDNKGARTVSSAVTIAVGTSPETVNQEPEVIITTPSNNKYKKYKKNEQILIVAEASDPDGSISKVEFKSGDITLSEATTAPYTYLFAPSDTGKFLITAVATDNLGAKSSSTGIELEVALLYDINSEIISLYPNPTTGQFTIDFTSGQAGKWSSITIVSLTGTVVYKDQIEDHEYGKSVDITDVPAGNYILMISNNQEIIATKKVIKR